MKVPADVAAGDTGYLFETSHPRVQDFLDESEPHLYDYVAASLLRGRQYLPQISSILEEEGLPRELAYLPIIESGFKLNAVSPAGAVGPWQFMRATGRRYGLRIDQYVDERRDPEKATRAAARYLRDLYDMFEDWHLSLAAYNRGEGAIAQLRSRTDDYWEMSAYLPRETRNYVPRFLAAVEIVRATEEDGGEGTVLAPSRYDSVTLDRPISLRTVAELAGCSVDEIAELNPAVCRGVVPAGYVLRVPAGSRRSVEVGASLQRAAVLTYEPRSVTHRVRRGETVGSIAQRYRISVKALMKANRLRSGRSLQAGKVLRIPVKRKPAYRSYASNLRSSRSRHVN